jgi:2-dehydro-3-deoxygalactonokinase
LIGLDWGTSSVRAMLVGAEGRVLAEKAQPWGITRLPEGGFPAAFAALAGEWRSALPGLPCLACGMVGSRQGWVEAPYCEAPAGADAIAAMLAEVPGAGLRIVPGVVQRGDRPDVMRGEETQVVGALGDAARGLAVLPGTHSKWVRVEAGRIAGFRTFMTGEVFATLRGHTILGAFAPETAAEDAAFARGVLAAHQSDEGLAGLLFSARALVLTDRLEPGGAIAFLSGLLIGDEIRTASTAFAEAGVVPVLIGEAALCDRYRLAFDLCGIAARVAPPGAAAAGLWRIARHAGLIAGGSV